MIPRTLMGLILLIPHGVLAAEPWRQGACLPGSVAIAADGKAAAAEALTGRAADLGFLFF
jgi:hypothetical protein